MNLAAVHRDCVPHHASRGRNHESEGFRDDGPVHEEPNAPKKVLAPSKRQKIERRSRKQMSLKPVLQKMALQTGPMLPRRLGQRPPRKPQYVGLPKTSGAVFLYAATGEAKARRQPQPQTKPVPSRPKKGAPRRIGKGVCSSTLHLLSSESRFQKHCTYVVHSCPIHLEEPTVSAKRNDRQEAFSTRCALSTNEAHRRLDLPHRFSVESALRISATLVLAVRGWSKERTGPLNALLRIHLPEEH